MRTPNKTQEMKRIWTEFNTKTHAQCLALGPHKCMLINYERLVLNLEQTMRRVVGFLGISWTEDYLHHERFVRNRIRVRENGWSTDQVARPVYLSALTEWSNLSFVSTSEFADSAHVYTEFGYNITSETYEYFEETV
jgi:hypothetical protein